MECYYCQRAALMVTLLESYEQSLLGAHCTDLNWTVNHVVNCFVNKRFCSHLANHQDGIKPGQHWAKMGPDIGPILAQCWPVFHAGWVVS